MQAAQVGMTAGLVMRMPAECATSSNVRQIAQGLRFTTWAKAITPLVIMFGLSITAIPMLHKRFESLLWIWVAVYPAILFAGSAVLFPYSEDVKQKLSAKGGASLLLFICVCCTFDYSASIMSVVDQPLFVRVAVWSRAVAETTVLLSAAIILLTRSAPIWTVARSCTPLLASIYLACCICVSGICGQHVP